jgi:uncharacterized protein (TIGR02265 family)
MGRFEYSTLHDDALGGDVDLDALLDETPTYFTVKGMFIGGVAAELSQKVWKDLQAKLEAPPKLGRYVPFSDYPVRDFQRVMGALARSRYADVGTREGFRRAGRKTFPTFIGGSTIGKVMVSVVGSAQGALLKYPDSYHLAAKGGIATAQATGPTSVSVRWDEYSGSSEFALGLLEGVVLHYGGRPRARVTVVTTPRARGKEPKPGWHLIEIEW